VQFADSMSAKYPSAAALLMAANDTEAELVSSTRNAIFDDTEKAHRAEDHWESRVEDCLAQLDVVSEVGPRGELLRKIARIYDEEIKDSDQALDALLIALEEDPTQKETLELLERVATRAGKWREVVGRADSLRTKLATAAERASLSIQIGKWYCRELADEEEACRYYAAALELDPESVAALHALADGQKKAGQDSASAAYTALEHYYGRTCQWDELIETCSRHVECIRDDKGRIELYGVIGQTYSSKIDDLQGALRAYRSILELDPENVRALERLAELYDAQGNARRLVECLSRIADLASGTAARAEALYRLGTALLEKQSDPASAEDRFEAALELDPEHLPSVTALRKMAMESAQFGKAVRHLEREQRLATSARRRAQLLVDLGNVYQKLADLEKAVIVWERARDTDPDNADAAEALLAVYWMNQEMAKAEPLLDRLVARAASDGVDLHELQNKLGAACLALGKDEKAKRAFLAAGQSDPSDPKARAGVAEACFRLREWSVAVSNLQAVLRLTEERDLDARAHTYCRLGVIQREQGLPRDALHSFERALEANSWHRPTLDALVRFHTDAKDWAAVVAYKHRVLDGIGDEEERFALLVEIGDISREKAKNPEHAILAFEDALQIHPDSHPMFHRLLGLYQTTEKWTKLIETLEAIVRMEQDPVVKSKFVYTLAQLYRDKMDDSARALSLFDDALDLNPALLEAFERINRLLTLQRNWSELERAFRKMIHRQARVSPKDVNLEYHLWHSLGLIYRDRLKSVANAAECFRMAARSKSKEVGPHQILAELYDAGDHVGGAIVEYMAVLQADSMRPDPYRGLFRIYMRIGAYDRAWCASAALAFLGKATEEERSFFETYRPHEMRPPRGRLDNELWIGHLFHPDDNVFVGKIFDLITPAAMALKTTQLHAAHQFPVLDSRFKESETTSTLPFTRALVHSAYVLGLPRPELYIRRDLPGGLLTVPSTPPASVAGQAVLSGHNAQDLAFLAGKHVSGYRNEHYIRNLYPRVLELKILLFAAISLVLEGFAVPEDIRDAVCPVATLLAKHLEPIQKDSLGRVVRKFVEQGGIVDLKRWMAAADLTGCRAGLLVSSDLESARKILYSEPQLPGELSPNDKMKDLVAFSVSESYFALRQALRITIEDSD
jgi:golgin subfamily B member 1